MEFRIADTFTESLGRLTGEEQRGAKTAAFDLQVNPTQAGLQMHRVEKSKDRNFWSARANLDIRIIVHRTESSLLLCYVDHHDAAYDWARRRKLETHPKTGAAQLVEIRETIQEIAVPRYVETVATRHKPKLFAHVAEADLLASGVPQEWLADVRNADEDSLFALAEHLPGEAAEALLEFATGGRPKPAPVPVQGADPFAHPDAQRRFRVMRNVEELERALEYPWDRWMVFLHPSQRQLVEREYKGPARVAGSAGTGKTIVALHRAVHLARKHPEARVLLTTFSEPLASALRSRVQKLLGNEPRLGERVDVHSVEKAGERLYRGVFGIVPPKLATKAEVAELLALSAAAVPSHKFTRRFLLGEWTEVVDERQARTWESYRDVPRLGRKTRLSENQRATLWKIFELVWTGLEERGWLTAAGMYTRLAEGIAERGRSPYEFVVVDESQDVGVAQLRFLASLGVGGRPDALFFAGDLGQRIFQQPFSWKALGVDVRGRSTTLRINYRTSHQIRTQADRLLDGSVADVDGNAEDRRGTVSVFNGPSPVVARFARAEAEMEAVAAWLGERVAVDRLQAHEVAVFVRDEGQVARALGAAERAGLKPKLLDGTVDVVVGRAAVGTMHLAKGLEFRAVAVMACDDSVIPSQERMATAGDESDLEEIYNTERHLLYVACTRARDALMVSGVEPTSEFLDDFGAQEPVHRD